MMEKLPDGPARSGRVNIGMWRRLVARVVRDDEVAGSNPVIPTITSYSRNPGSPRGPGVFSCPGGPDSPERTVIPHSLSRPTPNPHSEPDGGAGELQAFPNPSLGTAPPPPRPQISHSRPPRLQEAHRVRDQRTVFAKKRTVTPHSVNWADRNPSLGGGWTVGRGPKRTGIPHSGVAGSRGRPRVRDYRPGFCEKRWVIPHSVNRAVGNPSLAALGGPKSFTRRQAGRRESAERTGIPHSGWVGLREGAERSRIPHSAAGGPEGGGQADRNPSLGGRWAGKRALGGPESLTLRQQRPQKPRPPPRGGPPGSGAGPTRPPGRRAARSPRSRRSPPRLRCSSRSAPARRTPLR